MGHKLDDSGWHVHLKLLDAVDEEGRALYSLCRASTEASNPYAVEYDTAWLEPHNSTTRSSV